ncbi:SPOR domain-containing protein [Aurantimonas endophytica]|uniref:D-alanyl-D-alanine carboxypeptidase n=1 Tax=Aurantimonas endophytica TaxID=1522175 RepID=A0A7W6MN41_9HYPH|nr:D-alanyl-D-alanine carboxypeptidase [Aurantimonas endophytica]
MRKILPRLRAVTVAFGKSLGFVALGGALCLSQMSAAHANPRYAGFVIDANNGKVLYEDSADAYRYPASLTKMMTLYMTFAALKTGRISKSSQMPVSKYAAARPPSKLGLKVGSSITVEEGISALVTKSANDASVVMAEFLAGSEARFAEQMTATARKLGMSRTTFKNANGLPNSEQRTTARDMATLGIALREHFPEYYGYFSTRSYNFRGTRLGNHNRVLGRVEGTDGIKTGYINASGFNLVSSVKRDGKSIVAVVMGGRSGRSRDDHMVKLLNQYLPQASTRGGGALIASRASVPTPMPVATSAPAATTVASLPASGPVPGSRPAVVNVDERIALAYGSDAAGAIARLPQPDARPIVGRDALRAALVEERPASHIPFPAVSRPALTGGVPMPQVGIPGAVDHETTGSVQSASVSRPSSPWVVQIAAAPAAADAMNMLSEAKRKVGGPLSVAEPFIEPVSSGSQTLHRARFAGFASKDQAWAACAALKRNDYNCYAVAN